VTQALALAEKGDAPVLRILLGHILPRRQLERVSCITASAYRRAAVANCSMTNAAGYSARQARKGTR
jgi:hypothetical protein